MSVDILAIGVHPDDVELGCAGSLIKQIDLGYKVGILDLTRGELGTRGSAELRDEEAANAAKIIGADFRENCRFRDGFFKNDEAHQLQLIQYLRHYQPKVVFANAPYDRHPDHGRAANLVKDACFLSGLAKVETSFEGKTQTAWRPDRVFHYVQAIHIEPSFVLDISDYFDKKMDAVLAFKSQFYNPDSNEAETFISDKGFLDYMKARAISFGKIAGFKYAEGFISNRYLGMEDIFHIK